MRWNIQDEHHDRVVKEEETGQTLGNPDTSSTSHVQHWNVYTNTSEGLRERERGWGN